MLPPEALPFGREAAPPERAAPLGRRSVRPVPTGPSGGICYRAVPMASKVTYSDKELAAIRKRLEEERERLEAQLRTIEEFTFAASQSELTGEVGFDEETADAGTFTFERERDLSIENNIRDLLGKVERSLARLDSGGYGACTQCGKQIEKARVKALPYVELCLKDAQAQSRAR